MRATAMQASTSVTQSNPDWSVGYGYQFWQSRHNSYRGDGAFGQFCLVLPEHDAVVAITSGTNDLQGVLDKVWAHLLPAMGAESLPADGEALSQPQHAQQDRHGSGLHEVVPAIPPRRGSTQARHGRQVSARRSRSGIRRASAAASFRTSASRTVWVSGAASWGMAGGSLALVMLTIGSTSFDPPTGKIGYVNVNIALSLASRPFFEARRGKLHGFRFRDPFDFKSCAPSAVIAPTDQVIGAGDGIIHYLDSKGEARLKFNTGDEVRRVAAMLSPKSHQKSL